jgi:putative acetyltransferase
MIIRQETPQDWPAIEAVHIAAFANHPHSRQTEHLIVNALRTSHALSVSLVAELEGRVVGHIAFSPAKINGQASRWFLLGPVGVLPEFQRKGIGKELIRKGIAAIQLLGAEGCALVGEPGYYSQFGFIHVPGLVFEGVPAEAAEYCMCLPLTGQLPVGLLSHHAAFSATV